MNPDDLVHGTISGYKYHGCRCAQCRAASVRYEKQRRWLVHQGLVPTVPAHGFNRRVQALMAIGWTQKSIADALGIAQGNLAAKLRMNATVRRATHVAMCEVYEQRCMTVRDDVLGRRTASIAKRKGYPPPLAWDDIDDPNERPELTDKKRAKDDIDPVAVERILNGQPVEHTVTERRTAVHQLWAQGHGPTTIARITRLDRDTVDKDIERLGLRRRGAA